MRASIIIPTLNRAQYLDLAVRSFAAQHFPADQYEILIVDNGSSDDTESVVAGLANQFATHHIRYVLEPEPGLLSGRHRGAIEARAEILAFVDDDVQAAPEWLGAIMHAFEDRSVHLVGGPSHATFETTPPGWLRVFWHRTGATFDCGPLSLQDQGDRSREIDPALVWGLNFSIRKETLFDLGGFHPDCIPRSLQMFQGDGETGLALKIKENQLTALYVPQARVNHLIPAQRLTFDYFEERFFYQGVCDSFTEIRKKQSLSGLKRPGYREVELPEGNSAANCPEKTICQRTHDAYVDGYLYHQDAVKSSPALLKWVLKKNFFNYRLPKLEKEFQIPVRRRSSLSRSVMNLEDRQPLGSVGQSLSSRKPTATGNSPPKPVDEVIRQQVASYAASPADARQSYHERAKAPLENLAYFRSLGERLRRSGVRVQEIKVDVPDFERWLSGFPELTHYYKNLKEVYLEKCFEHYITHSLLRLKPNDRYIDIAASGSPWAEILKRRGNDAYRLDLSYPQGIDGINIGADATRTGLPAHSFNALSLQCSFECFMGDADIGFVTEASRILAPNGRLAVAPLYIEDIYYNSVSAYCDLRRVVIDPGARQLWRDDGYKAPFCRIYSPEAFFHRIYSSVPEDMRATVFYIGNLDELMRRYAGQMIYCFFVLYCEKSLKQGG